MKRKNQGLWNQYLLFLIGLFIASLGVAFSTKAGLGTSPVASVPYSCSLVSHVLTFGGWLNLWSVLQVLTQILVMKGKCNYIEIGIQTVLAFSFGFLTNFSCHLLRGLAADTYPVQFSFMMAGCVILAFGIWLQFKGGVAMLPGEAMNRAIAGAAGKRYEDVKIFFDVLYIAAAAVICLVFLGRLEGVREGSVIAALVIGSIIKGINAWFERVKRKRNGET